MYVPNFVLFYYLLMYSFSVLFVGEILPESNLCTRVHIKIMNMETNMATNTDHMPDVPEWLALYIPVQLFFHVPCNTVVEN